MKNLKSAGKQFCFTFFRKRKWQNTKGECLYSKKINWEWLQGYDRSKNSKNSGLRLAHRVLAVFSFPAAPEFHRGDAVIFFKKGIEVREVGESGAGTDFGDGKFGSM